jgi:hypothetical protein
VTAVPLAVSSGYSTGLVRDSGQMYDVKGLPSTRMSTRRSGSCFTISTPAAPDAFLSSAVVVGITARRPRAKVAPARLYLFIPSPADW